MQSLTLREPRHGLFLDLKEWKNRTFGERKRADDKGKPSLVSEASTTGRSHSSPDHSRLVLPALGHTRLACPKTQPPGSLFARNVGNGKLLSVQCCNVEPTMKHSKSDFHYCLPGQSLSHSEGKYLPIVRHLSWRQKVK